MATFLLKPASIAALQYLTLPNGEELDLIYMRPGETHAFKRGDCRGSGIALWESIPAEVRNAASERFNEVFDLPIEERQAWIDRCPPMTIDLGN